MKDTIQINQDEIIDSVDIKEKPEYELKFISRQAEVNEKQITEKIEENLTITYKYYDITLKNEVLESVNTFEEAEQLINQLKEQNEEKQLELAIVEKYTQNKEEIKTTELQVAKEEIQNKLINLINIQSEREIIESIPDVNGIKLATLPIKGTITSRYGESSRLRRSTHTGLDIAAPNGTPIQVLADGTVTFAERSGPYGNLVRVDHGNGVETWYAHTSQMYVTEGQIVKTGEIIAAVGSTGNSTGNHLHLEIRVNGETLNPQNYIYMVK